MLSSCSPLPSRCHSPSHFCSCSCCPPSPPQEVEKGFRCHSQRELVAVDSSVLPLFVAPCRIVDFLMPPAPGVPPTRTRRLDHLLLADSQEETKTTTAMVNYYSYTDMLVERTGCSVFVLLWALLLYACQASTLARLIETIGIGGNQRNVLPRSCWRET